VPPQARWDYLQSRAKLPTIGKDIDEAMEAVEKDNPSLKGVLPKEYAKEKLDKQSLGGLIDLIGTIALGDSVSKSSDILGQVYEYFLGQFALAEGKKGGQFYTPRSVVQLLVEMLEPYEGRVLTLAAAVAVCSFKARNSLKLTETTITENQERLTNLTLTVRLQWHSAIKML